MKFRLSLLFPLLAGCAGGDLTSTLSPAAPQAAASVFVSPSGEPFRPDPNGRSPFEQWFSQADRDGSGGLERNEFRADAERFFQTADSSGDGVIDDLEVQAYERDIAPEIAPDFRPQRRRDPAPESGRGDDIIRLPDVGAGTGADVDGRGQGGWRRNPGRDGVLRLLQEPQALRGADADQSRTITPEEFMKATEARFSALDANADGRLERAELRLLRPAFGRRRARDDR